ncbi:hypothetical protein B0H14DRAFT_2649697 [Mycena olivaceomarginata]|nr:hypothetical protein B0H14DRAFT_2649697 [Mycena olivaceomarginata]
MSFSKGGQWTPSESSGIEWNSPHVDGISNGFQQNPAESIRKTRFLSLQLLYRETRGPSGGHWIPLASWWSAVAAAISQCRPVPMSRLLPPRILLPSCFSSTFLAKFSETLAALKQIYPKLIPTAQNFPRCQQCDEPSTDSVSRSIHTSTAGMWMANMPTIPCCRSNLTKFLVVATFDGILHPCYNNTEEQELEGGHSYQSNRLRGYYDEYLTHYRDFPETRLVSTVRVRIHSTASCDRIIRL